MEPYKKLIVILKEVYVNQGPRAPVVCCVPLLLCLLFPSIRSLNLALSILEGSSKK